jgi:hypothetical protein
MKQIVGVSRVTIRMGLVPLAPDESYYNRKSNRAAVSGGQALE